MFRGLYTAVTGMQTDQRRLDISSNNMANINTTGFKKDVLVSETFPELLIKKINGELPGEAVKNNGVLEVTRDGEGFNVRTERGFFMVDSPVGRSYSRQVNFIVDEDGYLRTYTRNIDGQANTYEGNFLLNRQGAVIQVEAGADIDVNEAGQLTADGGPVADLIYRPAMDVIGTINSGRRFERTHINFQQGSLEETGNRLDLAINGEGFFRLTNPQTDQEVYTRNGNFHLSQDGEIINEEGYFLVGTEGNILLDGEDFSIGTNGEVMVDGQLVNQVDMVNILNLRDLDKLGHSYYILKEGKELDEGDFEGQLIQGFLEGSNISPVSEMVDMISIMRSYEANSRVLRAYDEILQRAVNELGKV